MPKNKFIHLFYCPMTGLGFYNGYRGDTWLKHRIDIFKSYVIPSLCAQKNNNFYVWMSWRPEERGNKIVEDFQNALTYLRDVEVIHTFGGLCFWDDKYEDSVASVRLKEALARSLPQLENLTSEADYVIITIQPSDDMYISTAAQEIQDKFTELLDKGDIPPIAVGWEEGYILNMATKELSEYSTTDWETDEVSTYTTNTNPPFFSILYTRDVFVDPEKHYKHIGPYKSHEYIAEHMPYHALEGRGFIVGTHGANISTTFNHRYKGRLLEGDEKDRVLMNAGIFFSPSIVIREGIHLWARKVLNKIPGEAWLRRWYRTWPIWMKIL